LGPVWDRVEETTPGASLKLSSGLLKQRLYRLSIFFAVWMGSLVISTQFASSMLHG